LPFGEELGAGTGSRSGSQGYGASDTNRWKYGMLQRDAATGLDHAGFRKYENFSGRWTSPDPLNGSIGDPQSFNHFSYAGNDPVNFIDPSGLSALPIPKIIPHPPTWHVNALPDGWDDMTGILPDWTSDNLSMLLGQFLIFQNPQNPDKAIAAAVDRARTILSTKNPCSDYFGANAIKALNTFESILTRGYPPAGPGNKKLGIIQSGRQTTHEQPTQYRTFQNAIINNDGPFFNHFSGTRIGGYDPGRNQSQVLQILHELAHLVFSGGAPLIPDDSGPTKKVDPDANTEKVLSHCKGEINKIKN